MHSFILSGVIYASAAQSVFCTANGGSLCCVDQAKPKAFIRYGVGTLNMWRL